MEYKDYKKEDSQKLKAIIEKEAVKKFLETGLLQKKIQQLVYSNDEQNLYALREFLKFEYELKKILNS